MTVPLRLTRTNPVDGQRDGKTGCIGDANWWALIDGVPFMVENEGGVCMIAPDMDLLLRQSRQLPSKQSRKLNVAILAWLDSVEYDTASACVFRLHAARVWLAEVTDLPGWPAARGEHQPPADTAAYLTPRTADTTEER